MKQANVRFNYDDYLHLPEDKRYEILDGELFVVPAPNTRHQTIALNLLMALGQHVKVRGLGRILHAPYDVVLSDDNVLQPDMIFIRAERAGLIGEANLRAAPDLVIEILSESTRVRDLKFKREIYARFAVREYWIVDPVSKTIEVLSWTDNGYCTEAVVTISGTLNSSLFPDLNLRLSEIFA